MKKVYPVDEKMIKRTQNWLLSRKDKKGGFLRNKRALDSFGGAPEDITNGYIVWSLTEAEIKNLDLEVEALLKDATNKKDTYLVGLAAGSLYNVGKNEEGKKLANKLIEFQQEDGSVQNSKTTITKSYGNSLLIETTAISILTWLHDDETFGKYTEKAMKWLLTRCQSGKFGSTQGTILSLKAIVAYDKARAKPQRDCSLNVLIDGKHKLILPIFAKSNDPIIMEDFSKYLTPGEHTIECTLTDGKFPFTLNIEYYTESGDSSDKCNIEISAKLSETKLKEGGGSEILCSLKNKSSEKTGMVMGIFGLPGGMEPRHDQLKELKKSGTIAFYEIRGREVIIYLRCLDKNEERKFKIDVIARIPGKYTGPASRGYLYYVDEDKHWIEGLKCEILVDGNENESSIDNLPESELKVVKQFQNKKDDKKEIKEKVVKKSAGLFSSISTKPDDIDFKF
jgi:alpha-2-macroglobulin-like protein